MRIMKSRLKIPRLTFLKTSGTVLATAGPLGALIAYGKLLVQESQACADTSTGLVGSVAFVYEFTASFMLPVC